MRVVYRGNFHVDYSTESHVAASLEHMGHAVVRIQEDRVDWPETVRWCRDADLFLWTCTRGFAHRWDKRVAMGAVEVLNDTLPTAALHLDLFFGLDRASWVREEPWFRLRHVFTADGDHEVEFAAAGVNHHFLRPAVYHAECGLGIYRKEFESDIAFVGGWQGYHPEYLFRAQLVKWLRETYGKRIVLWPKAGGEPIRGRALNDLYASVKVVVGDSCFAPTSTNYTSDRVYETVGRGGFLLYPHIEAVAEELRDKEHLVYYRHNQMVGVWTQLREHIAAWTNPSLQFERQAIREAGSAYVREHCTYLNRLTTMFATMGLS